MSGCYTCGSPEGNEARLCPRCVSERLRKPPSLSRAAMQPREIYRFPIYVMAGLGACALIALGLLVMYQPYLRVYTNMATPEDLYQVCKKGGERMAHDAKDPIGKALVAGMAVEMCDKMKKVCTADPHGDECRKIRDIITTIARS
jgi:hypothetical protein